MEVESKFMIDQKVVTKKQSFCGIDVYQHNANNQDNEIILFFVKGEFVFTEPCVWFKDKNGLTLQIHCLDGIFLIT